MLKTAIPLEKATFQRELTYTIAKTKKKGKKLFWHNHRTRHRPRPEFREYEHS